MCHPLFGEASPDQTSRLMPEELRYITYLGGATGALKMQSQNGDFWVRKKGAHPDHCTNEFYANVAYRLLNVPVPESELHYPSQNTNADPVLFHKFIKGKSLAVYVETASKEEVQRVVKKIQRNYVVDCFLGNWDVVGLEFDNIIIDEKGTPWRIDNGGALSYRAQGSSKGKAWDSNVREIKTMADPRANWNTAQIFKGIPEKEILRQINVLEQNIESLWDDMPESYIPILRERFEYLLHYRDSLVKNGVE